MNLKSTWDRAKNKSNLEKHDIDFADIKYMFESPTVTFEDKRFDYGERRFITLGMLENCVIVVVHTPRGKKIRIISARKANAKEKKIYQEQS